MSAHIHEANLLPGRSSVLAVTIALHALVIGALMAIKIVPELVEQRSGPITVIETEQVRPPTPTPIEDPQHKPDTVSLIAIPDVILPMVERPLNPEIIQSTEAVPEFVVPGEFPQVDSPRGTSRQLAYRVVRPTDDYYPATSMQAGEQGVAIVRVCIDEVGRITGKPAVQTSSGHRRLDQAAVVWAREALQFTPALRDGVAVSGCKGFRVNFALR